MSESTTPKPFPPLFIEFCAKITSRYSLEQPWIKNGKLYATDGKRTIRRTWEGVDSVPPKSLVFPDVDAVFPNLDEYGEPVTLTHTSTLIDCPQCKGEGDFECPCPECDEGTHPCETCHGSGKADRSPLVRCGLCWLNIKLIQSLILAGARFRAHKTSAQKPVYASLPDGSEALVMPVNKSHFEQADREDGIEPCNDEVDAAKQVGGVA